MKKHILSSYAKKEANNLHLINSKNTKETRTIEQTDNDTLFEKKKGTVKTFSVENSDSDETFLLKCTDKLKDGTETIESTDIYSYYFDNGTRLTKSIEDSDSDIILTKKKTAITETVETSDSDESVFMSNNKKTLLTETIEQSDPDNTLWFKANVAGGV